MLKLILLPLSLILFYRAPNPISWHLSTMMLFMLTVFNSLFLYNPLTNLKIQSLFIMDNFSLPLIMLTSWISALMFMASYNVKWNNNNSKLFSLLIISMVILLNMAFMSISMMMFYILFEMSLIPIFLMIMGWGYQPERLQASFYLMMYTIIASLPLLILLVNMYNTTGHLLFINSWSLPTMSLTVQSLWWLFILMAFLVKMPLFLFHLWLPKAHVEAPVAGSMVLAAILLKLGSYGLLRISFMAPSMNMLMSNILVSISTLGAFITSIICLRQTDLKSLIAYSSVGHMGLLIAGIMSNSNLGWSGASLMMIAHGLSSSSLFAISFFTYQTTQTRSIYLTKGMSTLFPHLAMMWFLACAANMAAPPFLNLLSEIFLMMSIMYFTTYAWFLLGLISFMSAAYSLFLYTASQHGNMNQFSNPLNLYSPKNLIIMFLHLIPLVLIILKPEIMMT